MTEPYFFEIPIYSCREEELENIIKKKVLRFSKEKLSIQPPKESQEVLDFYQSQISYPWKFNEIIGWMCLYVLGNQIRGEYYFVKAERIRKGIIKRKYEFYDYAFEHSLPRDIDSKGIFEEIITVLERLQKNTKPFKNRFMDLTTFKTIAKFIDWKKLVNDLNIFNNHESNK